VQSAKGVPQVQSPDVVSAPTDSYAEYTFYVLLAIAITNVLSVIYCFFVRPVLAKNQKLSGHKVADEFSDATDNEALQ
jgi:hypothetical protein